MATSGLDHDVKLWAPTAEQPTGLKGLKEVVHLIISVLRFAHILLMFTSHVPVPNGMSTVHPNNLHCNSLGPLQSPSQYSGRSVPVLNEPIWIIALRTAHPNNFTLDSDPDDGRPKFLAYILVSRCQPVDQTGSDQIGPRSPLYTARQTTPDEAEI